MKRALLTGLLFALALPAGAYNGKYKAPTRGSTAKLEDTSTLLDPTLALPAALDITTTYSGMTVSAAPAASLALIDTTERNFGGVADPGLFQNAVAARMARLQAARGGSSGGGSGPQVYVTPESSAPQVLQGFGRTSRSVSRNRR